MVKDDGDFHPMGSQSVKNHQQKQIQVNEFVSFWKFGSCSTELAAFGRTGHLSAWSFVTTISLSEFLLMIIPLISQVLDR